MLSLDKERFLSLILGLSLLIAGLIILFFVFSYASGIVEDPEAKLNSFVPEHINGPTASLHWFSKNTTVEFFDFSTKGDADIVLHTWDFGDGSTSNIISPTHTYDEHSDYTVTLTVEDANGESDSVKTKVSTQVGVDSGQALKGFDLSILNLGNTFHNIIIVMFFLGALAIIVLIGGKILLTGARLIRPTTENLKIKSKNGVVLDVTPHESDKNKENFSENNMINNSNNTKTNIDKDKEINEFFEKNQK